MSGYSPSSLFESTPVSFTFENKISFDTYFDVRIVVNIIKLRMETGGSNIKVL